MNLELPIFFKNEAFDIAELTGKDVPYTDFDVRKMTFYSIDAISKHKDEADGKEYACIHSNGTEFICALGYKETNKLIYESITADRSNKQIH